MEVVNWKNQRYRWWTVDGEVYEEMTKHGSIFFLKKSFSYSKSSL
jgi:hypothetical protein